MYKSEMHNAKETQEILEKGSPDIFFKVYHKVRKSRGKHVKKSDSNNMTLTKLAKIVSDGFKQVNTRIDNLTSDVNSLKRDVKDINTRLDYIVKANNLKDSK